MEGGADPLDTIPTKATILQLAEMKLLNSEALERALKISGVRPDRARWRGFLDSLLLVLAALFTVSGVFFFFAFNWASMHRFFKLGLLQAGIFVAVVPAARDKLERLTGKVALGVAALIVGALLAVYGQIYQTGADSYELFLYWALLIAGWVLISRFTPLWMIWIILLNLSLEFFWIQIVGDLDFRLNLLIFALNGGALLVWELADASGIEWLESRWSPRLLFLPAFGVLVEPTMEWTLFQELGYRSDPLLPVMVLLFIGTSAMVMYIYSQIRLDLFMLTVCAAGLMLIIDTWIARSLGTRGFEAATLLCMSALFIGEAALVVSLLRRVSRAWEARESG